MGPTDQLNSEDEFPDLEPLSSLERSEFLKRELIAIDHVIAKVRRAQTHGRTLTSMNQEWEASHPPTPEDEESALRVAIAAYPRYRELSVIAGEVVHQLRSSLDHLVCAAVAHNGGTIRRQQFPILTEPAPEVFRQQTFGVSDAVGTFLDSLQPYQLLPAEPRNATLAVLGQLSNTDKHRALNLVGVVLAAERPKLMLWHGDFEGGQRAPLIDGLASAYGYSVSIVNTFLPLLKRQVSE